MDTRNLGTSGLKISEIAFGNWLTHGSQVEEDAALACVRQALDEGITTFDTADVYANTAAETVLGKAHYIGVSEWTADQIKEGHRLARELHIPFVSNQPQYNMIWRVIEAEVVPTCEELGIGQIVWSPIAQGVLTGKYLPGEQPPANSRATDEKGGADMISRYLNDDVLGRVQKLKPIADQSGLSLAQLAIAWVLQNSNVSAAIIGASRPEQVSENVKAAGVRLDDDALKKIDEIFDEVIERDSSKTRSPRTRDFG